jgi:curved DNA-binding protein CbpA
MEKNNQYSFNNLEFNLYELLDLPISCSVEDIKKQFKKIVKRFHPDKISELEEKLYYNITIANHILSNEESRLKYNEWLLKSNKSHSALKNNFGKELDDMKQYFPSNVKEAQTGFIQASSYLKKRHGDFQEDNRKISSIYKEKEKLRSNIPNISKENFSDMKDFNKRFVERKINGTYNNTLVKSDNNIVPFQFKSSNFAELKDFDNMYVKDTSLNYIFSLLPMNDTIDYGEITEDMMALKINNYNNNTRNINSFTLDDIGI